MGERRGEYTTRGRAAELERQIVATEARLQAEIAEVRRQLADVRALALAGIRAQTRALVDVLKDEQRERGPMATTREKLTQAIAAVVETPLDELAPEARSVAEGLQIMRGLGFDPLANIVPDTDGEADVLIDQVLALLLHLRGDDLPPFDPERYGEDAAAAS